MAGSSRVGVVFVSHSAKIAEGLVDLARQMASGVTLVAAGGTDDGGIGTSLQRIQAAITEADAGAGVVVLADLGSAVMTTESALEFLPVEQAERVHLAHAPLVEGGVSAAVAAESGGDLRAVLTAAESAGRSGEDAGNAAAEPSRQDPTVPAGAVRTVTLTNADGLHARPAAEFVKLANTFPVRVTVNGRDAKSLLGIMSLGLTRGMTAEIASDEPGGAAAVDALAALVQSGFGESAGPTSGG